MNSWKGLQFRMFVGNLQWMRWSSFRGLSYHMFSHRGERAFTAGASRYLMGRSDYSYIRPVIWCDHVTLIRFPFLFFFFHLHVFFQRISRTVHVNFLVIETGTRWFQILSSSILNAVFLMSIIVVWGIMGRNTLPTRILKALPPVISKFNIISDLLPSLISTLHFPSS